MLGVRRWREMVADRKKMEGQCSTGQSPQWAVVPMEEEVKSINKNVNFMSVDIITEGLLVTAK